MISGKPVKSSMARTSSPASRSSWAVPPVEISSMPSSARPRAKSTMPRLSDTDSSARRTRTAPGSVTGCSGMPASIKAAARGKALRHARRDPEQALERDAAELEERVDRLDGQIDEAKDKLKARADEAQRLGEAEDVAGDWRATDDQAGGEDPVGAHEERDEPSET